MDSFQKMIKKNCILFKTKDTLTDAFCCLEQVIKFERSVYFCLSAELPTQLAKRLPTCNAIRDKSVIILEGDYCRFCACAENTVKAACGVAVT